MYDIKIRPGITSVLSFVYTDEDDLVIDLTGVDLRLQVRECRPDSDSVVDWSITTGHIVLTDAINGEFELQLSATDTEGYSFEHGVYDLEVEYPSGVVDFLMEGRVLVIDMVTREAI